MKGWFDLFRTRGGPTLYSNDNRTSVNGDLGLTTAVYTIFGTFYIAFLIIFPGIREKRLPTFAVVTLSLFVGAVILLANDGSCWHVSESFIKSDFRAFSKDKFEGHIGVYVGLSHINITLKSIPTPTPPANLPQIPSFIPANYNERFFWEEPTHMSVKLKDGLYCGLPYPILTVLDYFSWGTEGFGWGRMYRQAGYYTSFLLWASFASWLLMVLLLVLLPQYGAYQMIVSGALMLSANVVYYCLIPRRLPLNMRFEDSILSFDFGIDFWLVFAAGALCLVCGSAMTIVDYFHPQYWSTILEVLPYDRYAFVDTSVWKKEAKMEAIEVDDEDDGSWEYPHLEEIGSVGFRQKAKRMIHGREDDSYYDNEGYEIEDSDSDQNTNPWKNGSKDLGFDENSNMFSFAMAGLHLMAPDDLIHFLHFQEKKKKGIFWDDKLSKSTISIPRAHLDSDDSGASASHFYDSSYSHYRRRAIDESHEFSALSTSASEIVNDDYRDSDNQNYHSNARAFLSNVPPHPLSQDFSTSSEFGNEPEYYQFQAISMPDDASSSDQNIYVNHNNNNHHHHHHNHNLAQHTWNDMYSHSQGFH